MGKAEFLWLHFSPKRGYRVQNYLFVLQIYKIFRLVTINFLSQIMLFSCQFWILQKPLVSKFSFFLHVCSPIVVTRKTLKLNCLELSRGSRLFVNFNPILQRVKRPNSVCSARRGYLSFDIGSNLSRLPPHYVTDPHWAFAE